MTTPGGDAADRALDDALALANEVRPAAGPTGPPANDPLAVALGHEPTARPQEPSRAPGAAQAPRAPAPAPASRTGHAERATAPMPRPAAAPRDAADPLSVALGEDATPGAGNGGRGRGRSGGDPLAVLFGAADDDGPSPGRAAAPAAEPDPLPAREDAWAPPPQARSGRTANAAPPDPVDVALALGDEQRDTGPSPRYDGPPPPAAASPGSPDRPPAGRPTAPSGGRGTTPAEPNAAPADAGSGRSRDPYAQDPHPRHPDTTGPRPQDPHATDRRPPKPRVREPHTRDPHSRPATSWPEARRIARQSARRLAAQGKPLGEQTLGMSLARSLVALTDLPSFDSSAMDGWAVAGPGPWLVKGQVLAGGQPPRALHGGHAIHVATGSALPSGTTAVLRSEHGRTEQRTDGTWLHAQAPHLSPVPGQEIRRRGQECRSGDELLPAGTLVTPTVLGLAAAAGYDELTVTARPRVDVLVLGDELLDRGLPRSGRVRDALGPMLPSWLRALGADVTVVQRLVDDADALHDAVTASSADLVVTTGGTAGGPVDHVHPVLAAIGARLLVDGVAVRPGHPMLLAALPPGIPAGGGHGGHLIGLPGNPLAAVSGMLTLVAPLLRTLGGRRAPAPYAAPLTEDVHGHPSDTRLVPVVFDDESAARPLHFAGPAMLRGLAAADGMAVIPPGGARAGDETAVLDTGALGPAWGSGA